MTPRILLVDDNDDLRSSLEDLLFLSGYDQTTSFCSASKALEFLQSHPVDIVLSDLLMPQMNGQEFYAETLKLENPPHFALITGSDLEDVRPVPGENIHILHKPFSRIQLIELIERLAPLQSRWTPPQTPMRAEETLR